MIVVLAEHSGDRPADDIVTAIERDAGVTLTFVRAAGPDLYVFQLDDASDGCDAALARLRRDARVRSVDVDERRRVHGPDTPAATTRLLPDRSEHLEARDA